MLEQVGIGAGVLIAGVLAAAMTKPDTFRVERQATMKAPPAKLMGPFFDMDHLIRKDFEAGLANLGALAER